jgi:hypothetical protein
MEKQAATNLGGPAKLALCVHVACALISLNAINDNRSAKKYFPPFARGAEGKMIFHDHS